MDDIIEFDVGNLNTLCPMEARISDEKECERAAKELGLEFNSVQWPSAPGGCFVYEFQIPGTVKFNRIKKVGLKKENTKPICRRSN